MGGKVAVFVADAAPDRVVGLIGVDTLPNVQDPYPREQIDAYVAGLVAKVEKQNDLAKPVSAAQ
jgi:hypothetical protein